jgi:hypothetical protein
MITDKQIARMSDKELLHWTRVASEREDDELLERLDAERDERRESEGLFGPDYFDDGDEFQDPGGRSALRRETAENPRNLPCPDCKAPNRLTPRDRELGYRCDRCADQAEGLIPHAYY